MPNVTLDAGSIQNVCGNVSGNWTNGNVYHVDCDITIPSGQTLTIDSGVVVKVFWGTKLTCDGVLNAVGTTTDRIRFTSLTSSPQPGGGIILF